MQSHPLQSDAVEGPASDPDGGDGDDGGDDGDNNDDYDGGAATVVLAAATGGVTCVYPLALRQQSVALPTRDHVEEEIGKRA